jgi:hypothetical protein
LNILPRISFCGVLTVSCSEIRHCAKRQNVGGHAKRYLQIKIQYDKLKNMAMEKETLSKAQAKFMQLDNVVDVRMGYKFIDGWITNHPAIIIKVGEKKTENKLLSEGIEILPKQFEGYPIDIVEPTLFDYLGELELAEVAFKTDNVAEITSKYFPPKNLPLSKVTERIKLNAHVSPEKGWENLKSHITKTKSSNTIAMYDFGAKHIRDSIIETGKKQSFTSLTLAIQKGESVGEGTKKDDLKDAEMIEEIKKSLKHKFKSTYIKIGTKNGWVPYSYHIKVSVSDGKRFWLSSGNWQSSNQPSSDVIENNSHNDLLQDYNREWNLIIENENLSELLEKYIIHDYQNNLEGFELKYMELAQEIFFTVPIEDIVEPLRSDLNVQPFEELNIDREVTLTPLLSPDNYFDEVMQLIESAQSELYIQNQTFNAPWNEKLKSFDTNSYLYKLVKIVLDKQNAGIDVKIIFRRDVGMVRENLENLVKFGFDPNNIKVQDKCHTKGIIVDGQKVLVGSHNWSNMGVSLNRDASILFEDDEITEYFSKIFLHDWENLAQPKIRTRTISDDKPTQFMKISLRQLQEML